MSGMKLEEIETLLETILGEAKGWIPSDQLADMVELVHAGEPGVALENFCSQLFEFDVVVPFDFRERLRRLGEQMGVAHDYWERLAVGS
jgi:hypothetical protein